MKEVSVNPDFLFEVSWEVCNKVGGIYTVLSTRAKTVLESVCPNLIFIGPDFWQGKENPLFVEDVTLFAEWLAYAKANDGLLIRAGRWAIPGNPVALLVDFQPFFSQKNEIYGRAWQLFGVDSLHAYGDYDEAFTAALEPYIQKLESAKGIIYCPECNRLLERIIQENHDIADECGNEAFRMFSYRANLIGFLKGMVLYILNDCQWCTEIADFVRFSIQDDLWNKMRFFGQEMEQMILQEEGMLSKMPRNLYEMMPDVFTEDEFKSAHKRMGLNGDAKALMRKWMSRKMVQYDEIGRVYSKTDEWEKKGKKQTKRR